VRVPCGLLSRRAGAECASKTKDKPGCCPQRKRASIRKRPGGRVAARVERCGEQRPQNKGEWGCSLGWPKSGDTLYEQKRSKYFVTLEHEAVFTTGWPLAKLGPEYRFHPTLEERGPIYE